MKNVLRLLVLMILGLAVACDGLTTPEEDDLTPLAVNIGKLPPGSQDMIWLYASNRWALEWLDREYGNDDFVGTVWCTTAANPDEEVEIEEFRTTVRDVVKCLLQIPVHSFEECTFDALNKAADLAEDEPKYSLKYGKTERCRAELHPDFKPHLLPIELRDPKSWRNTELAKVLIAMSAIELSRMPSLMAALGISVGAGGALIAFDGIGLLLCPLSESVECPDDPSSPFTPQQPVPPGDR